MLSCVSWRASPAPVGITLNAVSLADFVITHLLSGEIARPRPVPMRTGGGTVGIAQENGVISSSAVTFLFKQDFSAIPADVACNRPSEPSEFTLFFAARCQAANANANLMGDHQRNTVANVLQPHASGNVGDPPLFPIERDFAVDSQRCLHGFQ